MPTTAKSKEPSVTPLAELSLKSQDQVIGAVASVQNSVASGYGKVTSIVVAKLPKSLPSLPTVPFAPKPKEVAELSFGFAEKLLATQKAFVGKLLDPLPAAAPKPAPAAKATK
ncbi:MAG TPA: hypothetical protein VGH94_00560 [Acidimicrobiales bacterium]|jgi:hypothetical protein